MIDQLMTTQSVAPEDLRQGQFIAILRTVQEFMPHTCDAEWPASSRYDTVRVAMLPDSSPAIYRVEAVCLPFVLVERCGSGRPRTLDTRRVHLANVDERFAKLVAERYKPRDDDDGASRPTFGHTPSQWGDASGAD
ncbi:MAG: hypothetical protein AAGI53_09970 [Planctomycetota bacterium]